jgi:hypothetical protein
VPPRAPCICNAQYTCMCLIPLNSLWFLYIPSVSTLRRMCFPPPQIHHIFIVLRNSHTPRRHPTTHSQGDLCSGVTVCVLWGRKWCISIKFTSLLLLKLSIIINFHSASWNTHWTLDGKNLNSPHIKLKLNSILPVQTKNSAENLLINEV